MKMLKGLMCCYVVCFYDVIDGAFQSCLVLVTPLYLDNQ